jgi:LDH2 family malate/lactate/ureidoglycolate dehydrogenase
MFIAAHMGMAKAIEMAKESGIGMVSVKHCNHFRMSAWVVQQALDAGIVLSSRIHLQRREADPS